MSSSFVRAFIFGIHQNEVKAKGGHRPIKDRQRDAPQIAASRNAAVSLFQLHKLLKD